MKNIISIMAEKCKEHNYSFDYMGYLPDHPEFISENDIAVISALFDVDYVNYVKVARVNDYNVFIVNVDSEISKELADIDLCNIYTSITNNIDDVEYDFDVMVQDLKDAMFLDATKNYKYFMFCSKLKNGGEENAWV